LFLSREKRVALHIYTNYKDIKCGILPFDVQKLRRREGKIIVFFFFKREKSAISIHFNKPFLKNN